MEPVIQESAQITLAPSFPPLKSLQQQNQTNNQSPIDEVVQFHKAEPPTHLAPSRIHSSQSGFRDGDNTRSIPPVQRPGPSTSHSQLQMGGGTSSVNSVIPAFSSQVPNRTNYQIYTAPPNDRMPGSHGFSQPAQPSIQTLVQPNEAPAKPSTLYSNIFNKCSLTFIFNPAQGGRS